mmetsp:Transcript_1236/g.3600  ORF Transcript_1236/g.3600 Transcript_1236/m.3600 type:complete len:80 (+) Transcript_1236:3119-3358(+)
MEKPGGLSFMTNLSIEGNEDSDPPSGPGAAVPSASDGLAEACDQSDVQQDTLGMATGTDGLVGVDIDSAEEAKGPDASV